MERVEPHHTLLKPTLLVWEGGDAVELFLQLTAPGPRRAPRTVVLALDASQAALDPARRALVALVDALGAEDRLGVVSSAREAMLLRPAVRIGDGVDAHERLLEIERSGFANLSAGLFRAIGEARRARENAWRAAWERAHDRPSLELAGVLERLGPCDAERPASPQPAWDLLGSGWSPAPAQVRLLEAASFADVVLVADGDPGRGETEPEVFAAIASRARAHGVRVSTIATAEDPAWQERLALVAGAGGGRHLHCVDPGGLEHAVDVVGRGDPEPIAAQAVTVRLRPVRDLGEVETGGRMRRIDHDGEVLLDLGDLRAGEVRQLGVRIALGEPQGRRRRTRADGAHRSRASRTSTRSGGAADAAGPLARVELEWLVAEDGAHERVRLPVHDGLRPDPEAAVAEPARAWREPIPDHDHWEAEALDASEEPDEARLAEDAALRALMVDPPDRQADPAGRDD